MRIPLLSAIMDVRTGLKTEWMDPIHFPNSPTPIGDLCLINVPDSCARLYIVSQSYVSLLSCTLHWVQLELTVYSLHLKLRYKQHTCLSVKSNNCKIYKIFTCVNGYKNFVKFMCIQNVFVKCVCVHFS